MTNTLDTKAQGTIFGVALNYRGLLDSHWEAFHQPPYRKPPVRPVLFIKTPNTRNRHGGTVTCFNGTRLQPGPALGVVVGRAASRVRARDAMAHVMGYTIVNEFSLPEDSYYRPAVKAKCRDGYCVMGPDLLPTASVPAPGSLGIRLFVNGALRQSNTTANWVRGIAQLIEELSEFMTLNAGDVLITGTPEGRVDVVDGDCVVVEIDGLGRQEVTIRQEEA